MVLMVFFIFNMVLTFVSFSDNIKQNGDPETMFLWKTSDGAINL